MNLNFIKQINEYVIESILEASDADILSMIDSLDYPTSEDITTASQIIKPALKEDKRKRLERKKSEFYAYKEKNDSNLSALQRQVGTMISDIVAAIQRNGDVPEGIIMAFRNQQTSASDEDIAKIWQDLVELGLINPGDNDQTS